MSTTTPGLIDRRVTLGALAAAAAGLALPLAASARAIKVRGMTGGGLANFESSDASFSLVATRLIFEDENREIVVGSVLWVDTTAGLTLASTRIDSYGDLEVPASQGEGRRIRGQMSVNHGDVFPFRLDVIDGGPPGSGLDSVNLIVGADAESESAATPASGTGFRYAAAGAVTVGDIQDVDFDLDTATAYPIEATPTT